MTREEAIKMIKAHKFPSPMEAWQVLNNEAIDMAISALHFEADCRSCMWREKYEEQTEPSDLISRADTLAKIKEYCIDGDSEVQKWFDTMGIEEVINTMPSVSIERVVRCKDCERYGRGSCPRFYDFISYDLKDDDFCSDGVAKMKGDMI